MPVPSIDIFEGEDVRNLVDSLEKQRKELMFILENLDTANVNGFNASVINAGTINGKYLHINSDTTFEAGYGPGDLRTEMNTQFDVIDGLIQSKVSTESFDLLGKKVSETEANISVMVAEINLKASSATVTNLNNKVIDLEAEYGILNTNLTGAVSRVSSAEVAINGLRGDIALKASTSVTDSLGSRLSTAEISVSSLNGAITQKVTYSDFTGANMVSMINQTAANVTIQAKNIDLLGITNVANTLYIGENYKDSTPKSIWFRGSGGGVSISSPSLDALRLGAIGEIILDGDTVDLSRARFVNWGSHKPVAVWG